MMLLPLASDSLRDPSHTRASVWVASLPAPAQQRWGKFQSSLQTFCEGPKYLRQFDFCQTNKFSHSRDLQLQHMWCTCVTYEVAFHPRKSVLNFLLSIWFPFCYFCYIFLQGQVCFMKDKLFVKGCSGLRKRTPFSNFQKQWNWFPACNATSHMARMRHTCCN